MVDILGPADAVGAVSLRPAETRSFGANDSWFADCTSDTAEDGTDVAAAFLNGLVAHLRNLYRSNGLLSDGVTPVVSELLAGDIGVLRSVQHLIQRGQTRYALDTGSANHVVAALSPAAAEYKEGMVVCVKIAARATGASGLSLNGLPEKPIVRLDGTPTQDGDLVPGMIGEFEFDGTSFQLNSPSTAVQRLTYNPTLYVRTDGNDANDGSANTPAKAFATIQGALNRALTQFTLGGKTLAIQLGIPGTYSAFSVDGAIGNIAIYGDAANQNAYVIQGTGPVSPGNAVIAPVGGNTVRLEGVKILNTGTINHTLAGKCTLKNVTVSSIIGLPSNLAQIQAGEGMTHESGLIIDASAGYAIFCFGGTFTSFGSIAINSAAAYANAVCGASLAGKLNLAAGFTGAPTGKRYYSDLNSVINTYGGGANFIPGTVAGSTATGGQYA